MVRIVSAAEAAEQIPDGAKLAVNASSGLMCPDKVLAAIGERFLNSGHPRGITSIHPIAAGDMFGTKGIDHLAHPGLIDIVIAGSYPSGPSSMPAPKIWSLIESNAVAAYNVPSGVLFDLLREGSARRPGVLTKVGIGTFVDPDQQGCAMNERAASQPVVKRVSFEGDDWLYFPAIAPDVAIIRATTADERGNLTFEQEAAYLGAMELALAARNSGGKVIAQVKRIASAGSLRPHDVRVPGIFVDFIVEAPDQLQTTQTQYEPGISGEVSRPLSSFSIPEFDIAKVMARRVAMELKAGWAVNIGFGISANVPRILLEEGQHGAVTWVIEQGGVGGVPLLDFQFGCSANAEAFVPSPHQFAYLQAGAFDASLLSFLQIGKNGSVNVSRLAARPHVTAGAGGFVDITTRAKRLVFSGYFNAGAKLRVEDGKLVIDKEGKTAKVVDTVEHVSFAGNVSTHPGQNVTYITERCVMRLTPDGLVVTEIAPGVDMRRDILDRAEAPLQVAPDVKLMPAEIFQPAPFGLQL